VTLSVIRCNNNLPHLQHVDRRGQTKREVTAITKGKPIPAQVWTGLDGSKRLRLPDFKTIGTRRWEGRQHYKQAAFTAPQEIFLVLISFRG